MSSTQTADPNDLLTLADVIGRTRLSRPTIYRWMAQRRFPPPLKLSAGAVRWVRRDIDAWQASLTATRAIQWRTIK